MVITFHVVPPSGWTLTFKTKYSTFLCCKNWAGQLHLQFRLNIHDEACLIIWIRQGIFDCLCLVLLKSVTLSHIFSNLCFCRMMKTGSGRKMSLWLDFLGEGAQNQKQQASSCGVKFSFSKRTMEQRYSHIVFVYLLACQQTKYFLLWVFCWQLYHMSVKC